MRPNDTSAPGLLLFLSLSGVLVPHDRPSSAIDTKLTVPTLRLVTRVLGLPLIAARDKAVTAAKRKQLQKETAQIPDHVAKMRR
jgi:hypothetical protein